MLIVSPVKAIKVANTHTQITEQNSDAEQSEVEINEFY